MIYKIVAYMQKIAVPANRGRHLLNKLNLHSRANNVNETTAKSLPLRGRGGGKSPRTFDKLDLQICDNNVNETAVKSLPLGGQRGISLIEVLVAAGILVILSSIATVSYRGYILPVHLRQLRDAGKLFDSSFHSCISGSGWKINKYDGTTVNPCDALTKIGFACPTQNNGICNMYHNGTSTTDPTAACVRIRQTIQGKKYHIFAKADLTNRSNYQIACSPNNTDTGGVSVGNTNCTPGFNPPSQLTESNCDDWSN